MPKDLPLPSVIVSNKRHCTRIEIPLTIGELAPCRASFTRRIERADGTVELVPDGDCTLTPEEFGALPGFAAAYANLAAAVHAKRESYDA